MLNISNPIPSGLLTGYPKKFFKDFLGDYDTITREQFDAAKDAWMTHCKQWRADNPPYSEEIATPFQVDTPTSENLAPTRKWQIVGSAGRVAGILLIIYLLLELLK